jgi:hypothetical protein
VSLETTAVVLEVAAAVTAVMVARRHPEHRPAAVALVLFALFPMARIPLQSALSPFPVEPWEGVRRLLVYLDGAAVLGAAAVVPGLALAVAVSPERRRVALAIVGAVWLAGAVILAALYPSPLVRGLNLQRVYLAADLFGLFVATVSILRFVQDRRPVNSSFGVALALVVLDVALLLYPLSPWREGTWVSPLGHFDIIQGGILVFFGGFTALQGVVCLRSRS